MTCRNAVYINPVRDLGELLLKVEKPGRYTGGEHGRLAKKSAPKETPAPKETQPPCKPLLLFPTSMK
uniref:Uncharacterized protein n=1 Tax=uncultured bacterium contig00061 TaxID=1181544 RepID=A0A806JZN9_9BACT|nr:hypothetical protein [uncultured bacterium contig00061]